MGLTLAYTTSTVRDIYTFAVFCSVTRPFFVSLVFMKGTLCCVLRSWGVRPCYGKSFEKAEQWYIQHAKQSTDFWHYIHYTFESFGARTTKGRINIYFGLQKHKLDQIAARNIRISLDKLLSQSKATRKLHEGKYDIRDKKLPRTVLVNSSNYSRSGPASQYRMQESKMFTVNSLKRHIFSSKNKYLKT